MFKKQEKPVLMPDPANPWESRCVLNPAVVFDEASGKFVMLYRAAGNDARHQIRLGLAESADGIHFTRKSRDPVFEGKHDEPDGGCVEDPRLIPFGDLYYLTYAARAYAGCAGGRYGRAVERRGAYVARFRSPRGHEMMQRAGLCPERGDRDEDRSIQRYRRNAAQFPS